MIMFFRQGRLRAARRRSAPHIAFRRNARQSATEGHLPSIRAIREKVDICSSQCVANSAIVAGSSGQGGLPGRPQLRRRQGNNEDRKILANRFRIAHRIFCGARRGAGCSREGLLDGGRRRIWRLANLSNGQRLSAKRVRRKFIAS